ncbi:uncharacterized protein [Onthophagus taurus]|uniref:uncharacterized protein n=1 Tax=Onthophagus taurus TaxID=166361 RepID=UPI0039BDBF72
MKPSEINSKSVEKTLLDTVYNHIKIAGSGKFRVGDTVRISKYKHVFDKGYLPNWTAELFKIVKVKITDPISYLLEDVRGQPIKGAFYDFELQRTAQPNVYLVEKVLKRKKDKLYVKRLGFDSSHNSWISNKDIS